MIKSTVKVSLVALYMGLTMGCASNSSLRSDVDDLQTRMTAIESNSDQAMQAAQSANSKAAAAETAALEAAALAEEANAKLDRMFKKSMMK